MEQPKPHGFELNSYIPGYCRHITVRDDIAYIANGWDGISILDTRNLLSPQVIGHLSSSNFTWCVRVYGDIAYVAEHPREDEPVDENIDAPFIYPAGVQFVDVSGAAEPREVGRYIARDFVDDISINDIYLYVLANNHPEPFTGRLLILQAGHMRDPVLVAQCNISQRARQVFISDPLAYIAASDGLHVIDISQISNPREKHHIGNSLSLDAHGIAFADRYMYVAASSQGLRVFEIDNGNLPRAISRTLMWGMADSVAIRDNTAYVTDAWYGIWRFDITDRAYPVETGFFPLNSTGDRSIHLTKSHIFVTAGDGGLFILRDTLGYRDLNKGRNPWKIVLYDD